MRVEGERAPSNMEYINAVCFVKKYVESEKQYVVLSLWDYSKSSVTYSVRTTKDIN